MLFIYLLFDWLSHLNVKLYILFKIILSFNSCSLQSSQFEIKFPLTTWTSSLLPSTSDLTAHQTSFQSSLYIPFPAVSHDQLCWMNCAWVKLTFIIVVRLALCFGFVTKTDLITHWCLSVVAEQCLHIVKAFSVSHSPYQQVGWGFTRS